MTSVQAVTTATGKRSSQYRPSSSISACTGRSSASEEAGAYKCNTEIRVFAAACYLPPFCVEPILVRELAGTPASPTTAGHCRGARAHRHRQALPGRGVPDVNGPMPGVSR